MDGHHQPAHRHLRRHLGGLQRLPLRDRRLHRGTTAEVDYAPLNANGTVGSWTATTSLLNATYFATSVAYNGYVYGIGGCATACPTTEVDYAQIQPAGYLGAPSTGTANAWAGTTGLPAGVSFNSTAAYNGHIYSVGGCTTTCASAASATNAVYFATITNGTIGSWTTATNHLATATYKGSLVASNSHLYYVGGVQSSGADSAVVDITLVNSNGSINAWSTTALPAGINSASAVAYNGYLYYAGGCSASCTNKTTVEDAPISSTGALVNTLTSCPSGGTLSPASPNGTWCTTTALPTATAGSSAVYNGYIYEVGGCTTACGSVTAVVEYAPINSDGSIGSWTATTSLTNATEYGAAEASNGYLYQVGGYTTTYTSAVAYAPINSNGTIGSWTTNTSIPTATDALGAAVFDGYLYELGGAAGGSAFTTVDYALINNGGLGTIGPWTATTSLPGTNVQAASVAYNGYLYEIGGAASAGGANSAVVDYAPINFDGTIGSWTATTSIPTATFYLSAAANNGYLYELGGIQRRSLPWSNMPSSARAATTASAGAARPPAPSAPGLPLPAFRQQRTPPRRSRTTDTCTRSAVARHTARPVRPSPPPLTMHPSIQMAPSVPGRRPRAFRPARMGPPRLPTTGTSTRSADVKPARVQPSPAPLTMLPSTPTERWGHGPPRPTSSQA